MSDYRSVLFQPEETLFLYSMGYEDQPELAHWGPGRRRRRYCILHYVTEGCGWFCGHPVRRGQGFYIHADVCHEYHADPANGWNYFWMILSEDLAKQYVLPNVSMDENGIFPVNYTGKLLLERARIFADKRPLRSLEALSLFFSILAMHDASAQPDISMPAAHLNSAKILIENCFAQRLTVTDVARRIHINDRYLYNLFIRYEGISPKEYIDRCRIRHACSLLTDSSLSVTEISGALGFSDVCTFSKFFRRHTDLSPLLYRQQSKDGGAKRGDSSS